jgi:hypothetical protein
VNVNELLDWIGARLSLDWITQARETPTAPAAPPELAFPPEEIMTGLRELIRIGYVRGIQKKIDEIAPQYPQFANTMRNFAARFQLDAMADFVKETNELQP